MSRKQLAPLAVILVVLFVQGISTASVLRLQTTGDSSNSKSKLSTNPHIQRVIVAQRNRGLRQISRCAPCCCHIAVGTVLSAINNFRLTKLLVHVRNGLDFLGMNGSKKKQENSRPANRRGGF